MQKISRRNLILFDFCGHSVLERINLNSRDDWFPTTTIASSFLVINERAICCYYHALMGVRLSLKGHK